MYSCNITKFESCQNLPTSHNIKLADSNIDNKNLAIDILVGVDFYWDMVVESLIKGKSGPVALNTKVGYVLSGPIENSCVDECNSVMLTHVTKVQAKIVHSYDRIKDNFHKVRHQDTFLKLI